jgi:hypothetical protein
MVAAAIGGCALLVEKEVLLCSCGFFVMCFGAHVVRAAF